MNQLIADQRDALLDKLGLQLRHAPSDYVLPTLGLFGAGFLVGTGIALLVAPTSGAQLREDLTRQLAVAKDGIQGALGRA